MPRDGAAQPALRQARAPHRARVTLLGLALGAQVLAAAFFIGEALADFRWEGFGAENLFEGAIALALGLGVVFGAREMRRTLARSRRAEAAVSAASGAFGEMIEAEFDAWGLTPAERDVALFALKGADVAEIAQMRGAAPGTVRAQLTRIYAKAGVSGRAQLISHFIEELLGGPLTAAPSDTAKTDASPGQETPSQETLGANQATKAT